ncbi:MAG: hypothetical protein AB2693_13290, partial [Candidatus Thiodiazotropha sp.]
YCSKITQSYSEAYHYTMARELVLIPKEKYECLITHSEKSGDNLEFKECEKSAHSDVKSNTPKDASEFNQFTKSHHDGGIKGVQTDTLSVQSMNETGDNLRLQPADETNRFTDAEPMQSGGDWKGRKYVSKSFSSFVSGKGKRRWMPYKT